MTGPVSGDVVGLLYPGDMGAAVGRMLAARGARVVTTTAGRGLRTARRAEEASFEIVPSLADVAARADIVLSIVPPAAALGVADEYRAAALAHGRRQVFVDCNPLTNEGVSTLLGWFGGTPVDLVDGAIHGVASKLEAQGTFYLSGPQAGRVVELIGPAMRVRHLGETVGTASHAKMLMGGMSKGLTALVVELAVIAQHLGMEEGALASWRDHYPGVMDAIDRMLPTYANHAPRRLDEMVELRAEVADLGIDPVMTGASAQVIGDLAALSGAESDSDTPWTLSHVASLLAAAPRHTV